MLMMVSESINPWLVSDECGAVIMRVVIRAAVNINFNQKIAEQTV